MFEILPESDGPYLSIKARGTLTHGGYAELERRSSAHGKISALFDITDFEGWDLHGACDDFALGIKTIDDFERIAVVGAAKWQNFAIDLADVCRPPTSASSRRRSATAPGPGHGRALGLRPAGRPA